MTAGSNSYETDSEEKELFDNFGLVSNHIYTLISAFEMDLPD